MRHTCALLWVRHTSSPRPPTIRTLPVLLSYHAVGNLPVRTGNEVLKAMMLMAERPEMSLGASLLSLRRVLGETIAALDQMM